MTRNRGRVVENAAAAEECLTREVMRQEVERWRAMHKVARSMFEKLPAEEREVIRLQGLPTIVPLGALVGVDPGRRELASSILDEVARWLSYPLGTIERTYEADGATVAGENDQMVDDLRAEVQRLRAIIEGHLEDCPGAQLSGGAPQPQL